MSVISGSLLTQLAKYTVFAQEEKKIMVIQVCSLSIYLQYIELYKEEKASRGRLQDVCPGN